jgi:flagellar protein FliJ
MFRFRLQRVLDLREKREQESAVRLGAARAEEEQARQRCEELREIRGASAEGVHRVQSARPTVGQLQNLRFVVERLDVQLEGALEESLAAEQNVRLSLDEYAAAFRDRKVLDRLRTRARDTHRAHEEAADQRLMDDIALTGFNRARAAEAEGGADPGPNATATAGENG